MLRIVTITSLLLLLSSVAPAQVKSVYTSLDNKHCKTIKPVNDSLGVYRYNKMCSGIGGYRLALDEDKDRQLIAIVAPSGKTSDAGFGPDAYNSLGKTAEWRVRNGKPIALIIRIDERNESGGEVAHSGLAVSKITPSTACVGATVNSGKNWRVQARKLADNSASKPCLPFMGFGKFPNRCFENIFLPPEENYVKRETLPIALPPNHVNHPSDFMEITIPL